MNCRGVSRRLSAFIDNDLSPGIKLEVEDHLRECVACKRRLTEFEAVVLAARNLAPMTLPEDFGVRVMRAVSSRQESQEILSDLRYKLTLAGVAFMVTSAAIFFVIGPSTPQSPASFTGAGDSLGINSPVPLDFYSHPETKVNSFPIPEGSNAGQFVGEEQLVPADSVRPDEFILPNVQKVNENIDGKF